MSSMLVSSFPLASFRRFLGGDKLKAATNISNLLSRESAKTKIFAAAANKWSRPDEYSTTAAAPIRSGNQARRAFADYTFYKGKGAMSMKPGKPIFKPLDSGGAALEKEGCLFLEFAPATGLRQYDWSRKQMIALSVTELGTLVGLSMGENCEFFHDPSMGKSDAGKVRKVLKVEPTTDQSGFFFQFSVSNKIDGFDGKVTVVLSRAEYSVLRSSVNFLIPYLMGWHTVADPSKLDDLISDSSESIVNSANEWDK